MSGSTLQAHQTVLLELLTEEESSMLLRRV